MHICLYPGGGWKTCDPVPYSQYLTSLWSLLSHDGFVFVSDIVMTESVVMME